MKNLMIFILKVVFSSIIMMLPIYFINRIIPIDFTERYFTGNFIQDLISQKSIEVIFLFTEITLGIIVYFTMAYWLKLKEASIIINIMLNRIKKIFYFIKDGKKLFASK